MTKQFESALARGCQLLCIGAALCVLLAAAPVAAQEELPAALHGWEAWVLHGHETHRCPWLAPGRAVDEERICAWPGTLELQVDARGARFTQR
jgi:hypothetical protein